ncbi:MAG: hypothetical protein ACI31M_00460 [Bacilli bacterium]
MNEVKGMVVNMKIFMIAGKSGSGKDEVAKIIKEYYESINKKTVITRFSKYIRLFAIEMLDWDGKEETKPRKFLQDFGQLVRDFKPRFLLDRMLEDINLYRKYYDNVVICDVRLINEIETFKTEVDDVVTIHLLSNGSRNKLTDEEKKHITEVELDSYKNFDYELVNDYESDLKDKVFAILKGLK